MNYTLATDYPSYPTGTKLTEKDDRYFTDDNKLWVDATEVRSSDDFERDVIPVVGDVFYRPNLLGGVDNITLTIGSLNVKNDRTLFYTSDAALKVAQQINEIIINAPK